MATYQYTKVNKPSQLVAELEAVPELAPVGAGMDRTAVVNLAYAEDALSITVPDTVAKSVVDAVVAAHTPQPDPIVFTGADVVTASVRTTNATATQLVRLTLAAQTLYEADLHLVAIDAANGVSWRYHVELTAKRLNAGAIFEGADQVTSRKSTGAAATTSNVAAWAVPAPTVTGNDLIIQVTGAAGRTIDWMMRGSVAKFAPAGI